MHQLHELYQPALLRLSPTFSAISSNLRRSRPFLRGLDADFETICLIFLLQRGLQSIRLPWESTVRNAVRKLSPTPSDPSIEKSNRTHGRYTQALARRSRTCFSNAMAFDISPDAGLPELGCFAGKRAVPADFAARSEAGLIGLTARSNSFVRFPMAPHRACGTQSKP